MSVLCYMSLSLRCGRVCSCAIETESKKHETKNINVSTHNTHNTKTSSLINSAHEINLAVLTISAAGLAWFLFT